MQKESENPTGDLNHEIPLTFSDQTQGQNLGSTQNNLNQTEQNQRHVAPDSVIINLDGINESSTSYPVVSYKAPSRLSQQQYQLNISQTGTAEGNDDQIYSNENRERNTDEELLGSHFSNNNTNNYNDSDYDSNESIFSGRQSIPGTLEESPNHRANSQSQSFEKEFVNKCIPFLTFLSLMIIYDHREGILIFIGLFVTFIHANSVVKREVSKQSQRSLISLGIISVNILISICLIYFIFQDQHLYKNLIFIPPNYQLLTIWDVLWIVGITDFVLKFVTVLLKVGVVCIPGKLLAFSARGKWYLTLERGSQLYRGLAPIQPWLSYLIEIYQGPENAVGMFFLVAYAASKGSDIMSKIKLFVKAVWKLFYYSSLGSQPGKEDLIAAGAQCPICHDEYDSPIMLQCKHIFCESCVTVWFDREQTCPLCRAKIADDPSWRDGATSLFIQLL